MAGAPPGAGVPHPTRNSAAWRSPRAGAYPPRAHLAQAAIYYHFAKFLFVQDMDQLRAAHAAAVRCLHDALPYLDPPGERIEIGFDGSTLAGILRRPRGPGPHPVVILIAGLDSAKEEFRPTEELFLRRGLATFAVDGPGQGEAEYDLAMRPDWEVPGAAIIDAVTAQPGLDPARTGIWGVSLGGYYAARLASRRCPGPGLHRAVRALQLRRELVPAAAAHPRCLRRQVEGGHREGGEAGG